MSANLLTLLPEFAAWFERENSIKSAVSCVFCYPGLIRNRAEAQVSSSFSGSTSDVGRSLHLALTFLFRSLLQSSMDGGIFLKAAGMVYLVWHSVL